MHAHVLSHVSPGMDWLLEGGCIFKEKRNYKVQKGVLLNGNNKNINMKKQTKMACVIARLILTLAWAIFSSY